VFRASLASLTGPEDQRQVIGRTAIQHNEITMVFDELHAANFGWGIRIIADRRGTASMVLGSDRRSVRKPSRVLAALRPSGGAPSRTQQAARCVTMNCEHRELYRPGDGREPRPRKSLHGCAAGGGCRENLRGCPRPGLKLRKIEVTGGPVQSVCDFNAALLSGFISADKQIVFGRSKRVILMVFSGIDLLIL
jgi:hypothetical protein